MTKFRSAISSYHFQFYSIWDLSDRVNSNFNVEGFIDYVNNETQKSKV